MTTICIQQYLPSMFTQGSIQFSWVMLLLFMFILKDHIFNISNRYLDFYLVSHKTCGNTNLILSEPTFLIINYADGVFKLFNVPISIKRSIIKDFLYFIHIS